jgi:NADPH:quinone reductase-like Zn-dependent oxidoreductase
MSGALPATCMVEPYAAWALLLYQLNAFYQGRRGTRAGSAMNNRRIRVGAGIAGTGSRFLTNTALVGVLAAGYSPEHIDGILQGLTALMNRGQLRGTVLEKVPFDEVPEALTRVANRTARGKCVVEIGG